MSSITSVGTKGIALGVFADELAGALYDLRWMLVLMFVFVFADLWFGCCESAMKRKEATTKKDKDKHKFHFSSAGRKTLNKVVDYLVYMLIGCVLGFAVTEPLDIASHITTSALGVGFGCLFEIASIVGHILALHHVRVHVNWRKLGVALVKIKHEELGDAIDGSIEEVKKDEKN